ncbi:MAG: transglycosylase family protein [Microthrixaceae bacterium]
MSAFPSRPDNARRRSRRGGIGVLALAAVTFVAPSLLVAGPSAASQGVSVDGAGPGADGSGTAGWRDDPDLARAVAMRRAASARVGSLTSRLADADQALATRFRGAAEVAGDVERARANVREALVQYYIANDTGAGLPVVRPGETLAELSMRLTYTLGSANGWRSAVDRYRAVQEATAPALVAAADRREGLAAELGAARDAYAQTVAVEADAERVAFAREQSRRRARADAAARSAAHPRSSPSVPGTRTAATGRDRSPVLPAASDPVVAADSYSAPLPELPEGGPSEAAWAALRRCESGGDYRAVSPSGAYRGAYQFDRSTWASLGGLGDPAAAPAVEQDARAKALYFRRGARPWPVCGRHLYG